MKALKYAFKHVAKKLLGTDPPKQRSVLSTDLKPMSAAAHLGELAKLEVFLKKYEMKSVLDLTRNMNTGASLLHHAARKGNLGVLGLLLDYGADIHDRDARNATPLHIAAGEGRKDVIDFLLQRGAAIGAADMDGWQPLAAAAFKGRRDAVEFLLDHKADVNAANVIGLTALHKALGHPVTTKLLLERGADVDARDALGCSALLWLCGANDLPAREQTAAILLAHGARLDFADSDGKTARDYAGKNGYDAVSSLIDREESERSANQLRLPRDVTVRRIRLRLGEPRP